MDSAVLCNSVKLWIFNKLRLMGAPSLCRCLSSVSLAKLGWVCASGNSKEENCPFLSLVFTTSVRAEICLDFVLPLPKEKKKGLI